MIETLEALRRNRNLVVVALLALLIGSLHPLFDRLAETRAWRDLTARTPVHSVTVTRASLTPRGAELAGEMVKRRCEYAGLSAYVRIGPVWQRAQIDTSAEDTVRPPGDRPSVPGAQLWGPWVIVWRPASAPEAWAIYAHHRCPEGPQVNLFAAGRWPR